MLGTLSIVMASNGGFDVATTLLGSWAILGVPLLLVMYFINQSIKQSITAPEELNSSTNNRDTIGLSQSSSQAVKTFEFLTDGTEYSDHEERLKELEYGDPVYICKAKTRAGNDTLELKSFNGNRFGYVPHDQQNILLNLIDSPEIAYLALLTGWKDKKPTIKIELFKEPWPPNAVTGSFSPARNGTGTGGGIDPEFAAIRRPLLGFLLGVFAPLLFAFLLLIPVVGWVIWPFTLLMPFILPFTYHVGKCPHCQAKNNFTGLAGKQKCKDCKRRLAIRDGYVLDLT